MVLHGLLLCPVHTDRSLHCRQWPVGCRVSSGVRCWQAFRRKFTWKTPRLMVCSRTSGVITSTSTSASTASHLERVQQDSRWLFLEPWKARALKP